MSQAAIACLVVSVGAHLSNAQTQAPKMDGYPEVGAPATLTLLSDGAAPRTTLRYTVPATYQERLTLKVVMDMAMDMGGVSMQVSVPAISMTADLTVTAVSATGDITFNAVFTGATADNAPGVNPALVAALQTIDATVRGLKETVTISNRGIARSATFDLGNVSDAQVRQMMNSAVSALENLSVPLPEEAVGAGARWEERQGLSVNGVQTFQKTTTELVAFDGKTVILKKTVEQTAPPQAMSNPGLPPGADVQLDRLSARGTGSIALPLASLVPKSDATTNSEMVMRFTAGGNEQTMTMKFSLKLALAPQ